MISATDIPGVVLVEVEPNCGRPRLFRAAAVSREFAAAGVAFAPGADQPVAQRRPAQPARDALPGRAHAETKLVRVTRGAVFDVVVDLRPDSPTYRRWKASSCLRTTDRALFIPEGIAHGFLTLEPDTDVLYQMRRLHGRARPG